MYSFKLGMIHFLLDPAEKLKRYVAAIGRSSAAGIKKPPGCGAPGSGQPCLLDGVLERLAGGELGYFFRPDLDLFAGLGVAAYAGSALGDSKGPEANQRNLVALLQGIRDRLQG